MEHLGKGIKGISRAFSGLFERLRDSAQAAREAEALLDDAFEQKLASISDPLGRLVLAVGEGEKRNRKRYCFKIEQAGTKEEPKFLALGVKRGREGDLTHWAERAGFSCTDYENSEKNELVLIFTYNG